MNRVIITGTINIYMKKHNILLKIHNKTKLKYLCYHYGTYNNCFTYAGSGKYWTHHLRKHGRRKNDIKTVVLLSTNNKEEAVQTGVYLSKLFNIVESDEYANLTVECCQTTAEPLLRPEVRLKAISTMKQRWLKEGLSDKEYQARLKGIEAMRSFESRKKRSKTMKATWKNPEKNSLLLKTVKRRKTRLQTKQYTSNELKSYKKTSERQLGKTMQERLNNPDYIDPRKGKSGKELYGEHWESWNKGKKWDENTQGVHYNSKPFYLTINDGPPIQYKSEREFFEKTHLNNTTIIKLKQMKPYTIKRLKNSRHNFNNGDILKLSYNTDS